MKKIAVLGLIFIVAGLPIMMAFFTANVQAPLTWNIQTVDSIGYVGSSTSLALDLSDYPHISYRDGGNGDLKYATWTGSAWSIQTVDSAGDVGMYTSIALDSLNNPHISYYDDTNNNLKYAKWTGATWSIQTVDSIGYSSSPTSLALDSSDYPHISYYSLWVQNLKYATWTGSAWSIQTVDPDSGINGYATSLALDSFDSPHMAYYRDIDFDLNYEVRWAKWTGSKWYVYTVDSGGAVGGYISIALDSNLPHISYYDVANGDLKYWTILGGIQTVDSMGDVGRFNSLALDSLNNPHISYFDETNDNLKYAKWVGSVWSIETVDSTGDVGRHTSIALDSSNSPHISYYDNTNSDLKYAKYATSNDFSVSVSPSSQTVTAGGSTSHTVTVTLLNGTPESVSLDLNLPASVGVYTFTPQSGTPTFSSTLIITTLNTAPSGTYNLEITAAGMGLTKTAILTLAVTPLKLTLSLNPRNVSRGSPLTISGQLIPGQSTSIRLYYRVPHATGLWRLATTLSTNSTGFYNITVTVPIGLTPGDYDLVAVWFDTSTGTYAASPILLLTIT